MYCYADVSNNAQYKNKILNSAIYQSGNLFKDKNVNNFEDIMTVDGCYIDVSEPKTTGSVTITNNVMNPFEYEKLYLSCNFEILDLVNEEKSNYIFNKNNALKENHITFYFVVIFSLSVIGIKES